MKPTLFLLLLHTWHTLQEMLGGFLLATVVALPLGFAMHRFRAVGATLQPLFVLLQCLPMFVLAPLMVLWFGFGYVAVLVPTALMIFLPIALGVYQGLRAVPKDYLEYFSVHQATAWQTFWKLQAPFALPYIASGFKVAAAVAGIGAIAGEFAGAEEGLGVLMLESRRAGDLESTFAAVICLFAITASLYGAVILLEKKISWRSMMTCLLLLFSSCGRHDDTHRLALDWLPNPNHVPLYAGIAKGFFGKLAIHRTADPANPVPYLLSGQVDLALSYMPDTLRMMQNGAKVRVVGALFQQPLGGFLFRKGEGIEKPEDLNGKILGYCIDGSNRSCLDALLFARGIVPSEMRNVSFDMVGMLAMKRVDVLYGAYWNIEGAHLKSLGVETAYFPLELFGQPTHDELLVLAKEDADEAFLQQFRLGLEKSIAFCKAHPEEAFALYIQANPNKSPKTVAWEKEAWIATMPLLAENQEVLDEKWDNFADWLIDRSSLCISPRK